MLSLMALFENKMLSSALIFSTSLDICRDEDTAFEQVGLILNAEPEQVVVNAQA